MSEDFISTFNPEDILSTTVSGRMLTQRAPIPPGDHAAVIRELIPGTYKKANEESGMEELIPTLEVVFELTNPDLLEQLKIKKQPTVRRRMFLNFDDNEQLDLENNIPLGQLREAVGQNEEDEEITLGDLIGSTLTVVIVHNIDKNDNKKIYSNVESFHPA